MVQDIAFASIYTRRALPYIGIINVVAEQKKGFTAGDNGRRL